MTMNFERMILSSKNFRQRCSVLPVFYRTVYKPTTANCIWEWLKLRPLSVCEHLLFTLHTQVVRNPKLVCSFRNHGVITDSCHECPKTNIVSVLAFVVPVAAVVCILL